MSASAHRIRSGCPHDERGNGGFREDLGHYVRSNWEANFARILKHEGKSYEYEPTTFTLEDGKTYTPDFLSEGIYYEVKGFWTDIARHKFESFVKSNPSVRVQIIDGLEYDKLRLKFSNLITWEGK